MKIATKFRKVFEENTKTLRKLHSQLTDCEEHLLSETVNFTPTLQCEKAECEDCGEEFTDAMNYAYIKVHKCCMQCYVDYLDAKYPVRPR